MNALSRAPEAGSRAAGRGAGTDFLKVEGGTLRGVGGSGRIQERLPGENLGSRGEGNRPRQGRGVCPGWDGERAQEEGAVSKW